ncbi:MAG TPA: hypothetical protein VEK11_22615 [Thermoanaerobaculia bacterium]|jgi:hypothetical protein|nr:hypothetical protein [Thermoanaerobaculia bacterium]
MESKQEQKPGTGVDRTVIRQLLALTPEQRAEVAIRSANNWADLKRNIRRV